MSTSTAKQPLSITSPVKRSVSAPTPVVSNPWNLGKSVLIQALNAQPLPQNTSLIKKTSMPRRAPDASATPAPPARAPAPCRGTVYIMRGIPGSGKSYVAKSLCPPSTPATIASADNYFINKKTGEYEFNFKKLTKAHQQCRTAFLDALLRKDAVVVVDNTHTQRWEYADYVKIATLAAYDVRVIQIRCPNAKVAEQCAKRNGHGVPAKHVLGMWRRMEADPAAEVRSPYGIPPALLGLAAK